MAFAKLSYLVGPPEVNPVSHKARSIPVLNPRNKYGRVFFFCWFSFMVAFLSWFAFPPLVSSPETLRYHGGKRDANGIPSWLSQSAMT